MSEGQGVDRTAIEHAANRLHHLGMLYAGAMAELAKGEPVGLLPTGYPGLKLVRDFIAIILFTRAEISGLSKLLLKAKVFTEEELERTMVEEYNWFAQEKAHAFGVEITDAGLILRPGAEKQGRG